MLHWGSRFMGSYWNTLLAFQYVWKFDHKKLKEKVYTYTLSHDCHLFLSDCCFHVHDSLPSHFSSLYSLCFLNFLFQNSSSSLLQSPMRSTEDKSCHSGWSLKVYTDYQGCMHVSFKPNHPCLAAHLPIIFFSIQVFLMIRTAKLLLISSFAIQTTATRWIYNYYMLSYQKAFSYADLKIK